MPIEFRCTECQNMLRVPDESAGAKAKCPQCDTIVAIPAADSFGTGELGDNTGFPPIADSDLADDGSLNPYSAPANSYDDSPGFEPAFTGAIVATETDAGQVISYAWSIWKANLWFLVGINAVVIAISLVFSGVQIAVESIFSDQGDKLAGQVAGGIIGLFGNAVQIFLGIGQAIIALKLLRGHPAEFGELFSGGPLFWRVLGASILAGLAMSLGFLACIIPGIILMLIFWPFYWLLVDEKATAIESFGMASPIGRLNVSTSIILWLATIGIAIVGFMALCVGILFALPLGTLIWGTAYLMMSGQLRSQPQ